MVQVGQTAPEFCAEALVGDKYETVKLTDFAGKKWVVLFFYPLDFTFI